MLHLGKEVLKIGRRKLILNSRLRKASGNEGFTLLEVIVALLIIGVFFGVILGLFTEQWRSHRVMKDKMEAHYAAMIAGRMVSDAIRGAEHVQWVLKGNKWILEITPSGENFTDEYYIEDKHRSGVKDFYREHLRTPNPYVTGIENWECIEGEAGLWTISVVAKAGEQEVSYVTKIKARSIDNQDL
ncbi:MAG: type II secretion system protein [Desulfitobacterium sp.]|nr:type II secretion system protein [Desulfitobacterium sp.]